MVENILLFTILMSAISWAGYHIYRTLTKGESGKNCSDCSLNQLINNLPPGKSDSQLS